MTDASRRSRAARWITLLCAVAAGGCAASHNPGGESEIGPLYNTSPGPVRQTGMTREVTRGELRAIEVLMETAERVRELEFRKPVPVHVQDPAAIMGYVDTQIEVEQLEKAADVYRSLGLLPSDLDVRSLLLRLMGEQVVGYYDAEEGRLVVRDDVMRAFGGRQRREVDLAEARIVLVHELVHALQDQNLGLSDNIERDRDSDADSAFRALIEGDATLAMIGFALEGESVPLSALTSNPAQVQNVAEGVRSSPLAGTELNSAPAIVRVPLLSAYVDGLSFVANLHGDGGWGRVDRIHSSPPSSTEQILHPERYARFEAPEQVRLDLGDVLAGYELRHEDTLGELELSVYFSLAAPEGEAAKAAEGWGGDRLYAYRRPESQRTSVVWVTTWDDEAEAVEALAAVRRVHQRLSPEVRAQHLSARVGRAVLIVCFLPDAERQAVAARFQAFAGQLGDKVSGGPGD